jgi:hypothetical protein
VMVRLGTDKTRTLKGEGCATHLLQIRQSKHTSHGSVGDVIVRLGEANPHP